MSWLINRKKPYTNAAIAKLKCIRCGNQAKFQWNVCADGNNYRPICKECDVLLNSMVLAWMNHPNANNLILDYALEKGVDINDIIPPDQKLTILNEEFLDAVEKRAKLSFQNYHLSRRGQQLSMWDMYETHIIEASLFLAKR